MEPSLTLTETIIEMRKAVAKADEAFIRCLLERWVSGLTPAVARDQMGEIIGLCDADAPVGSEPFVFSIIKL